MSRFRSDEPSRSDGFHGILIEKDRQLNLSQFKKGTHPWIQLDELLMIGAVHLDLEILDFTRAEPNARPQSYISPQATLAALLA